MNSRIFWELNEAYQLGVCTQVDEEVQIKEVLTEEELVCIQEWVEGLIEEGHDLDEYTDDELYGAYLEEVRGGGRVDSVHIANEARAEEKKKSISEEADLYDIVSEYLVTEGFCDSPEDADVLMVNMSEEWRESILDEAVRGSGRSIGNMITGNDIRSVSRSDGKSVYKKPKQNDKIETNVRREVLGIKLRAQGEKEHKNDLRDRERQAINSRSIKRLNAIKNAGVKHGDHKVDFTTSDSNSGYREVPTDYRARKRRASGR